MAEDFDDFDDFDDVGESVEARRDQVRRGAVTKLEPTIANGQTLRVPDAALDSLVETAWAFPGFRISFGAFEGPRAIRFFASAGTESLGDLGGVRIDLTEAKRFIEATRGTDLAVPIEDVASDYRTRPIADQLTAQGSGSLLVLPLRRGRDPQPFGVVMMDSASPRTWGAKESAALERLAPIIALCLEHVQVCAELESVRASAAENNRRVDAMRGMVAAVYHDSSRIVGALLEVSGRNDQPDAPSSTLTGQLARLCHELDSIQQAPLTPSLGDPVEVSLVLRDLRASLEAILAVPVRVSSEDTSQLMLAGGQRTSIERMLINLISHASYHAAPDASVVLESRISSEGHPQLRVSGSAIAIDDALALLGATQGMVSVDELGMSLWLARCEALLRGAHIELEASPPAIVVTLPDTVLPAPPFESAGGQ